MRTVLSIRKIMTVLVTLSLGCAVTSQAMAADKIKLRMAGSGSPTGTRAIALDEQFAPAVAEFAEYEAHWNSSLFKQGTELEAIARGNLEMALASAQELAVFFPEFSIFATGYVHRDAAHQTAVFKDPLMDPFKKKAEEELNLKLLSVMYFGARQLNLRSDQKVMTPEDLAGVNLRMPGTDAWQFLGKALGANPTPMAFAEVYTGLQSGAIDGQDNPLPTMVDKKFYEVTKQVILTSHLVDLNYITISKKLWDQMTPEQQATVQAAADAAAKQCGEQQVKKEKELQDFLKEQGLQVYEPDLDAFRTRVQKMYLESEIAESWPEGLLDKINSL
ncbi:MAG: TRAP transporter substrate-binding protein DctP [Desulfofustis sp.]|nr:TRAP transporter substrate-binding protein DctP [Desulfofustis sp.]MBT8354378.1 TRAP transporter substrate-binding protein DctP [Desulfofustis sp.]NNF47294.1 TRAP transporter substrate-binding protein DctP [Desulfofustis sp.]NNK57863.1 TRAP transporter substrate-binding protein DctP [Desulfofustis sp.]